MKTSIETNQKEFDTVETFRAIKEKISKEIIGLSYEERLAESKEKGKSFVAPRF